MRQDQLALAVALLTLPLVGINVAYKPQPSASEVADLSQQFRASVEWVGKVAPDFELDLLDGQRFRLADHIGREVIVLNFFATWCGPCRGEMPELSRIAEQSHGKPFVMLGIDAEEKHDLVATFVRDMKLKFPVGIDDSGKIIKRVGVSGYPTTIVVGPDGKIELYQSGAISNADVAFSAFLEPGFQQIAAGHGVTREAYLAAAAKESYPTDAIAGADAGLRLSTRARGIADAMDCPCGCAQKVRACGCSTSKKIKARLARDSFEGKTDEEVAKELDKEFCMKGM
jgi:thiol-disulfide isomerase/thioredoxin